MRQLNVIWNRTGLAEYYGIKSRLTLSKYIKDWKIELVEIRAKGKRVGYLPLEYIKTVILQDYICIDK